MISMSERLARALEQIDRENSADPSRLVFRGEGYPTAFIEGVRAHHWVEHMRPDAPDSLLIAARGHHLRRWEVSRESYPRTRQGYHSWRNRLYDFHAEAVGELMRQAGYDEDAVSDASRLLKKHDIKGDPDAQTYEDAVSLAFLEARLVPFSESVTDEQLVRALQRTWRKMSEAGHQAVHSLDLEPRAAGILRRAMG
jgi:hypothetical protein